MYKRILVPVDGSETSNQAVAAALRLARESGGRVRFVHFIDELAYLTGYEYSGELIDVMQKYAQKTLDDAVAMARDAGVPADSKLLDVPAGRLGELVAQEARDWEADLVAVGTHGRRGVGRVLLGSGAEQVLRLAPVPVLAVRAPEGPSS
jgi:nucleotide-binding universal stress UspA family protein